MKKNLFRLKNRKKYMLVKKYWLLQHPEVSQDSPCYVYGLYMIYKAYRDGAEDNPELAAEANAIWRDWSVHYHYILGWIYKNGFVDWNKNKWNNPDQEL
jgi:hypothetical protein